VPPAAYFFLTSQKKVCKKETLGTRIELRAEFSMVYSSNSQCDRQRGIFALSKTFFRRNTDVLQGKMAQRSVKRSAVWVRWELEEYTLAL